MRRAAPRRSLVALGAALVAGAAVAGSWAAWAALTDVERAAPGSVRSATVVLGGRASPPAISMTGLRAGSTTTATLNVDYRGSVPATLSLSIPSVTTTGCATVGGRLVDTVGVGSLTVTLGGRAAESYCALLDGVARPITTLQPGTVTAVPITVVVGAPLSVPRSESAVLRVSSAGGFTDRVDGRVTIGTGLGVSPLSRRVVANPAVVAVAPTPPAECAPVGYAETVVLDAARPTFDAARDRPGRPGPFFVLGTEGADTVVGSAAGDCVSGLGENDVVDGAGGDDVLVGGTGDDRLTGGAGTDRVYGGAGADVLVGGPESPRLPNVLDGGPDGAACPDSQAGDVVVSCATPSAPVPVPVPEGSADPPAPVTTPVPVPEPLVPDSAAPVAPVPAEPVPPTATENPPVP